MRRQARIPHDSPSFPRYSRPLTVRLGFPTECAAKNLRYSPCEVFACEKHPSTPSRGDRTSASVTDTARESDMRPEIELHSHDRKISPPSPFHRPTSLLTTFCGLRACLASCRWEKDWNRTPNRRLAASRLRAIHLFGGREA